MKKITFVFAVIMISFWLVASVALADTFIVGGYNSKKADLEDIQAAIPGSKIVISQRSVPVKWAAATLLEQLKAEGFTVDQEVSFVAHSWGGQLLKQLVRDNPEIKVKKMILIGTPNKSFWFLPDWLFDVKAERGDIDLYAIAGKKSSDRWYLRSGEPNDGVVETSSAVAVDGRKEDVTFLLDHTELLHAKEVINQVVSWLKQPTPLTIAAAVAAR